jgi:hypothetical protein
MVWSRVSSIRLCVDSTTKAVSIVGFDETNYNRTGSLTVTSSTGTA